MHVGRQFTGRISAFVALSLGHLSASGSLHAEVCLRFLGRWDNLGSRILISFLSFVSRN